MYSVIPITLNKKACMDGSIWISSSLSKRLSYDTVCAYGFIIFKRNFLSNDSQSNMYWYALVYYLEPFNINIVKR